MPVLKSPQELCHQAGVASSSETLLDRSLSEMFCSGCGRQIEAAHQFCPGCGSGNPSNQSTSVVSAAATGTARAQQIVVVRAQKNPGAAAVLSFFWSGLGQIYNGEIGKGIGFLILYCISLLLMFVVIGFITTPILWIFGMVDAYKTAERLNALEPTQLPYQQQHMVGNSSANSGGDATREALFQPASLF
jgi:TM2 domain-containing membrane protein YozV